MPTYEEFLKAVKNSVADGLEPYGITDEKLDEYLKENEDIIKEAYDENVDEFKEGKINRDVFLAGGVSGIAWCLEMDYDIKG